MVILGEPLSIGPVLIALCGSMTLWVRASAAQTAAPKSLVSLEQRTQAEPRAPSKGLCLDSHLEAQQAQSQGRLVFARERAVTCADSACPRLVVDDCVRWLSELDQRMPSVVFDVRVDGEANASATVLVDGNPVSDWSRGESLRLDPGEHEVRFELKPYQPIAQHIIVAEGMRFRVISVEFSSQKRSAKQGETAPQFRMSGQSQTERPIPMVVYPLLAAGVIGAMVGIASEIIGASKEHDLYKTCNPYCTDADLKPTKTAYLVGDLVLAASALSLASAGIIYVARPERIHATSIGVALLPSGGAAIATYRFR